MESICIIENSPRLAEPFGTFCRAGGVEYEVFSVYRGVPFPEKPFSAYILTGDFYNVSDGLEPYHYEEIDFIKRIGEAQIFGSCFSHQLISTIFGGDVGRRRERFFGWHRLHILQDHPVFEGLQNPHFFSLNGDEVTSLGPGSSLMASSDGCPHQVVLYGQNILTMQCHPEITYAEAELNVQKYADALSDRCANLHGIFEATKPLCDDNQSRRLMSNLISWLLARR
jgi:GMP synthase-like glutamine amidotransferase